MRDNKNVYGRDIWALNGVKTINDAVIKANGRKIATKSNDGSVIITLFSLPRVKKVNAYTLWFQGCSGISNVIHSYTNVHCCNTHAFWDDYEWIPNVYKRRSRVTFDNYVTDNIKFSRLIFAKGEANN